MDATIFKPDTRALWRRGFKLLETGFANTVLAGMIRLNADKPGACLAEDLPDPDESATNGDMQLLIYRLGELTVSIRYDSGGAILMFDPIDITLAKIVFELSGEFEPEIGLAGWKTSDQQPITTDEL